jgi:predicted enzyme related to lactoylglutathione lyase
VSTSRAPGFRRGNSHDQPAAKPVQVSIDCSDPARLATFWAQVLGYTVAWAEAGADQALLADATSVGPRMLFHRVPEVKVAKNRLHLDVIASGWGTPKDASRSIVDAEIARLVALGATLLRTTEKPTEYFAVMQDPEGNEFCIC